MHEDCLGRQRMSSCFGPRISDLANRGIFRGGNKILVDLGPDPLTLDSNALLVDGDADPDLRGTQHKTMAIGNGHVISRRPTVSEKRESFL